MTILAHYTFTWDDVLSALQRRMNDIDYRNGISFLKPGAEKSGEPLKHRCRATVDGIEIYILEGK